MNIANLDLYIRHPTLTDQRILNTIVFGQLRIIQLFSVRPITSDKQYFQPIKSTKQFMSD